MKILNICDSDYAGAGAKLTEAVNRHTEHEARHLCMVPHPFGYPVDIQTRDPEVVRGWVEWADVVNIHDAFRPLRQKGTKVLRPLHLIIIYNGRHYRGSHWQCHIDAKKMGVKKSLCITPDLVRYGGAEWLPSPIPVAEYAAMRQRGGGEPIVCQTPSEPTRPMQSTEAVKNLFRDRSDVQLSIAVGPHKDVLAVKAKADIFIDRFELGLGVSGLEALAMGIPTIAYAGPEDEASIRREIGYLPYFKATLRELPDAVEKLLSDKALYEEYVRRGNEYIRRFHDYPVVAEKYIAICKWTMARKVKPPAPKRGKPRAIGIITAGRQIGGAETLCLYFAEWLQNQGLDVWLHIGRGGVDQLSERARIPNLRRIGERDLAKRCRESRAVWLYGTKLIGSQRALARSVNRCKRVFAYVGGFNPDYEEPGALRVDTYWVESANLAEYVARYRKVPRGKMVVCPVPMPGLGKVESVQPFPDCFTFGVVGRFVGHKRVLQAVQAFKLLEQPDCRLVVMGDGSLAYRKMLHCLAAGPRVHFSGLVTKKQVALGLIKGFDCLVSASQYEGISITMREAMALGTPVVATEAWFFANDGSGWPGGTQEMIEDGATGMLSLNNDLGALVDNMRRMVDDGGGRNRLAENAQRFFEEYNAENGRRALEIL